MALGQVQCSNSQDIGYVTPNKDTLYLVNNDIGWMIEKVWVGTVSFDKPVIVYKDQYEIDTMIRTKSTRKPGVRYVVQTQN